MNQEILKRLIGFVNFEDVLGIFGLWIRLIAKRRTRRFVGGITKVYGLDNKLDGYAFDWRLQSSTASVLQKDSEVN